LAVNLQLITNYINTQLALSFLLSNNSQFEAGWVKQVIILLSSFETWN